jgi:acetyltransferase
MMIDTPLAQAPVLLRAIEPDDFELEREFVEGLSPATGYQRLMSPRRPSAAELQRWTRIDRRREGALIAVAQVDGRVRQVGVARYAMELGEHEAEMALVVADDWQGRGLGRQLLSGLVELARQSGVRRLFGITLSDNRPMLKLGQRVGFRLSKAPGAAIVTMMSLELAAG